MSAPSGTRARFAGDLPVREVSELFVMTGRYLETALALGVASPLEGSASGLLVALLPIRSPRSRGPGRVVRGLFSG